MEWASADGARWLWEPPAARDVVHLIGHVLPLAGGAGWREVAAWLASLCLGVEGAEVDGAPLDWDRLSRGERVRVVEALTPEDLDAWAACVVTTIGLTAAQLAQVRTLARVAASGGCECRRCKAGDERGPLKACLYAAIEPETERRVRAWWQLRDADLSAAPWWMWQVKDAWEMGRAEAIAEARKKQERKNEIDELLKKRGRLKS